MFPVFVCVVAEISMLEGTTEITGTNKSLDSFFHDWF
jgi:hypothetical protein